MDKSEKKRLKEALKKAKRDKKAASKEERRKQNELLAKAREEYNAKRCIHDGIIFRCSMLAATGTKLCDYHTNEKAEREVRKREKEKHDKERLDKRLKQRITNLTVIIVPLTAVMFLGILLGKGTIPASYGTLVSILFGIVGILLILYGIELTEKTTALYNVKQDVEAREGQLEARKKADLEAVHTLCKEKSKGFPLLAKAYADYFHLQDLKQAEILETKKHPAHVTAQEIRQTIAVKRREAEIRQRVYKHELDYYENLFPFLVDFKDEELEEYIQYKLTEKKEEDEDKGGIDPVKKWLTPEEYEKLSTAERNQRALDRYLRKKKTKWEIGRDYERFIGFLYEKKGYGVHYQGIVEGMEDLGRDLIAKKNNEILVIQCKCWSKEKTIHEKHICQLYGTLIKYKVENKPLLTTLVKGVFVTSTCLSDKAREFANELKIEVREKLALQIYPSIKCNISRTTGEKIYHLPFDQQYDRTLIEEKRSECSVETVAEAEALGFRRAYRWHGNNVDDFMHETPPTISI